MGPEIRASNGNNVMQGSETVGDFRRPASACHPPQSPKAWINSVSEIGGIEDIDNLLADLDKLEAVSTERLDANSDYDIDDSVVLNLDVKRLSHYTFDRRGPGHNLLSKSASSAAEGLTRGDSARLANLISSTTALKGSISSLNSIASYDSHIARFSPNRAARCRTINEDSINRQYFPRSHGMVETKSADVVDQASYQIQTNSTTNVSSSDGQQDYDRRGSGSVNTNCLCLLPHRRSKNSERHLHILLRIFILVTSTSCLTAVVWPIGSKLASLDSPSQTAALFLPWHYSRFRILLFLVTVITLLTCIVLTMDVATHVGYILWPYDISRLQCLLYLVASVSLAVVSIVIIVSLPVTSSAPDGNLKSLAEEPITVIDFYLTRVANLNERSDVSTATATASTDSDVLSTNMATLLNWTNDFYTRQLITGILGILLAVESLLTAIADKHMAAALDDPANEIISHHSVTSGDRPTDVFFASASASANVSNSFELK